MKVVLSLLLLCVIGTLAIVPSEWKIINKQVGKSQLHPITVGLKQRNLEHFTQEFLQVSNPKSEKYGQYKSISEIADMIAPANHDINSVINFFKSSSGVSAIMLSESRDFLQLSLTVSELERLFKVKMSFFHNRVTDQLLVRSHQQYQLPGEIAELVDMVSMISDFPATRYQINPKPSASRASNGLSTGNGPVFGYPQASDSTLYAQITPICKNGNTTANAVTLCSDNPPVLTSMNTFVFNNVTTNSNNIGRFLNQNDLASMCSVASGVVGCNIPFNNVSATAFDYYTISIKSNFSDGSGSDTSTFPTALVTSPFVTPQWLWSLYEMPYSQFVTRANQSVAEFSGQFYSPQDLLNFFGNMSLPIAQTYLVGPNAPNIPGDEATLDIQWILASAPNASTTFWSIGVGYLIEWALQVQNSPNPPLVHSISYGGNEAESPEFYRSRVDVEFQKLGMMGLSVVVASGDAGSTNIGHGSETCLPLQPQYPSSSAWVTTVSATFFTPRSDPICYNSFMAAPISCTNTGVREVAVSANNGMDWTTGGGFSNATARPAYQDKVVSHYLNTYGSLLPPSNLFNSSGRGYPDVSAVGHNLVININGGVDIADGTSAATPIFAGVLTRINDQLLRLGQPPLGFANPILYQAAEAFPETFYDVTVGNNKCGDVLHPPYTACCEYGYQASLGWDPITGLGTPRFADLLNAVLYFRGVV